MRPKTGIRLKKGKRCWYEAREQAPEAICLHNHPNNGPAPHNKPHPAQEEYTSLHSPHRMSRSNMIPLLQKRNMDKRGWVQCTLYTSPCAGDEVLTHWVSKRDGSL